MIGVIYGPSGLEIMLEIWKKHHFPQLPSIKEGAGFSLIAKQNTGKRHRIFFLIDMNALS